MRKFAIRSILVVFAMFVAGNASADQRVSDSKSAARLSTTVPNQYFVSFRDGVTNNNRQTLRGLGIPVRWEFSDIRSVSVRINNPSVLAALRSNPNVELVEAMPMHHKMDLSNAQLVPSLNNGLYGLITTKAVAAQVVGDTGMGIRIGVADTGLDCAHPDIAANYKGGVDFVDNDNNPCITPNPNETHGTHVAGTALGVFNNVGVFGVAYNAHLYHARVLGPDGTGSSGDVMQGVLALVTIFHCNVVNLSLGGGSPSLVEARFYQWIRNKGALVVAAAGNEGPDATTIDYPAGYPSNISVGAVDRTNMHASFSNTGKGLMVSAPGVDVLSSVPRGQGRDASVVAGSTTFSALSMEFAGATPGITGMLVNCGLGNPGDCPGNVASNIALIQRGSISFGDKVYNAMQQGAVGAIVYNNAPGNFNGTLGTAQAPDGSAWIPAVSVSDTDGAALVSRVGTSVQLINRATDWDTFSGTSMATPHVTGTVALIWAANPSLPNAAVQQILLSTCRDLGTPGYDTTYGFGIINALAAALKAH